MKLDNVAGNYRVRLMVIFLVSASLACVLNPFAADSGDQAAERAATLEVQLADARATATADARAAQEDGPPVLTEQLSQDFSADDQAFDLGGNARIEDQALLVGPYESCANDVGNFDAPVDCLVICTACGDNLAEYRMEFNFTFEEGLTDREFGVVLRFVDQNGDHLIDRPDYLLALGFNVFHNRLRLYLHEPDKIEPWVRLADRQAGFLRPGRLNHVEVQAAEGGRQMLVYLNESLILHLTGDDPAPGERLVQPWADAGSVGFLGLGRGVTARFDNFVLEAAP